MFILFMIFFPKYHLFVLEFLILEHFKRIIIARELYLRKQNRISKVLLEVLASDEKILEIVTNDAIDMRNILITRSNSSDELIAAIKLSSIESNFSMCSNSV